MGPLPGLAARDAFDPPIRRTRMENHPTLLVSWWCTGCALVLILVRLWGRCVRTEKLFMEDKIMALSIVPLFVRMALVDPVMLWGTNNVVVAGLSDAVIGHREVGSKLVLASRIFYALFIWMAKFTVSEYLRRLTSTFWTRTHQRVLLGIRVFLVITFIAVVIATLGECKPFNHYWQVVPDPGVDCRSGYAQLFVMSVCDIITDVLLVAFPISIIATSSMPLKRKLSVCALFALSVVLIAITSYRVSAIVRSGGRQQLRTLWASLEILAAAAVSNALILGSFVRDRGVKKSTKYKSLGGPLTSVTASEPQSQLVRKMTIRHWGNDSDEDLFATVRGRIGSTCESEIGMTPAPMSPNARHFAARYRDHIPSISEQGEPSTHRYGADAMELMDVGGILADPKSSTDTGPPKISDDSRTPLTSPRQLESPSSAAFDFADVGGLLSPSGSGAGPSKPVAVTPAPRQPSLPPHAYSTLPPVRIPPPQLRKTDSSLTGASGASGASPSMRRPSVASSQQTDESAGDSRAIALDMLAKIRAAREQREERAERSSRAEEELAVEAEDDDEQGRLFGEGVPTMRFFEDVQPG